MPPNYPDTSSITDILGQAVAAAQAGAETQDDAAAQTVEAEAANGAIRVSADLAGSVTVRIVDPRAVRLGAEVLGEEISTAVNAALTAAREQAGLPGQFDLGELAEKMDQLQQQSTQRLRDFMGSLAGAHAQIVQGTDRNSGGR